jgi:hypothetical protein
MLGARRGALRGGIWGRRAAVLSLGLSQWGERGQGQPAAQNRHTPGGHSGGATGDGEEARGEKEATTKLDELPTAVA